MPPPPAGIILRCQSCRSQTIRKTAPWGKCLLLLPALHFSPPTEGQHDDVENSWSWLPPRTNRVPIPAVRSQQWQHPCHHHRCGGFPPGGGGGSRRQDWYWAAGGDLPSPPPSLSDGMLPRHFGDNYSPFPEMMTMTNLRTKSWHDHHCCYQSHILPSLPPRGGSFGPSDRSPLSPQLHGGHLHRRIDPGRSRQFRKSRSCLR